MQYKIGTKQTTKMVEQGRATRVYAARNADQKLLNALIQLCERHNVPISWYDTMLELGGTCGIDVGAAMAALYDEVE